jgi:hypothetical protein
MTGESSATPNAAGRNVVAAMTTGRRDVALGASR